jgi:hypothetical protein
MSLLGESPTKLLALMLTAVALACAAVLLAGSAPANAAPKQPLALIIAGPAPGATNVPLSPDGVATGRVAAYFDSFINLRNLDQKMRLTNLNTGEDVPGSVSWVSDDRALSFILPEFFACGTTYEVTLNRVRAASGAKLGEVLPGVTLERGTASWTFTTVDCPA